MGSWSCVVCTWTRNWPLHVAVSILKVIFKSTLLPPVINWIHHVNWYVIQRRGIFCSVMFTIMEFSRKHVITEFHCDSVLNAYAALHNFIKNNAPLILSNENELLSNTATDKTIIDSGFFSFVNTSPLVILYQAPQVHWKLYPGLCTSLLLQHSYHNQHILSADNKIQKWGPVRKIS